MKGIATDYAGKVTCKVVPKTDENWDAQIKKYGFKIHGMVLTDDDDKIVWKEEGHKQTNLAIRTEIKKALGE